MYYTLVKNLYSRIKLIHIDIFQLLKIIRRIDFSIINDRKRYNKVKITKLKIYKVCIISLYIHFLSKWEKIWNSNLNNK